MKLFKAGLLSITALLLVFSVAFAHGEEGDNPTAWVANGMEGSLSVIDRVTGEELKRLPSGLNPHILNGSPDGKLIYVINAGAHDLKDKPAEHQDMLGQNSLWVYEAATGNIVAKVAVGTGPTHPIASRDGQRVYVTNTDEGSVSVIDTASWEVVATVTNLPEPHDGELTPDGSLLYLATSGNSTMTVVDTKSLEVTQTFAVGAKPRGLAVGGENGEIAYVSNKGDGTLSIINVLQGQVTTVPVGKGIHALRVSPDSSTVYAALSNENAVAVIDGASGELRQTILVGAKPEQLDLSADGAWLFVSNNGDATLSIIDLIRGTVVHTIAVGKGAYGVQASNLPFEGLEN